MKAAQRFALSRGANHPRRRRLRRVVRPPFPSLGSAPGVLARTAAEQGMVPAVARPLFGTYLVPFEITSILLLAAMVGAVVLAKRKL